MDYLLIGPMLNVLTYCYDGCDVSGMDGLDYRRS